MPLRDMDREQMWLLPPSLDELLPLDHPARFVAVFVDALDKEGWAELGVEINGDPLGAPAYHPRALLCVWLYGFMTGVRSCRKLEAACRDQIPYLWLTGWQQPDHNTLWRFYKEHRQAMRRLFKRTVRTAVAMQLVDLAVQAVDGTKVAANATRDRTYDAERGRRLLDRLEKAIEDLEAQNEEGEDAPAVHLPEELADKRALREQVRQAMDDLASQEGLRHINLTDKDARLMKTRHGIVPGYNAQSMVSPIEVDDEASGMLITAVDVVDDPTDYGQFTPMLEQAEETTGTKACMTLADAGYYSGSNLSECAGRGQGWRCQKHHSGSLEVIRTTRIGSPTMRAATVSCVPRVRRSPSNVSTSPPREPISGSTGHPEPSAGRALPLECARKARMAATYPSGRTTRHCGATALGWPPRQLKRCTS